MTGKCDHCYREIALVVDIRGLVLKRHGRYSTDPFPCPGSDTTEWYPVPTPAPKRSSLPGIGKRGTAPCGHEGEHVSASMVLCGVEGCDGKPARSRVTTAALWACPHAARITFNGTTSCAACGHVFKRGP